MFTFNREKQLQEYLKVNFERYFNCQLADEEFTLAAGRADLIGRTDDTVYIIELKKDVVTYQTIGQLYGYVSSYKSNKKVVGIAAAPKISSAINKEALPDNIMVLEISDVKYESGRKQCEAIYFEPQLLEWLKERAEEQKTTVSVIVNQMTERMMKDSGQ